MLSAAAEFLRMCSFRAPETWYATVVRSYNSSYEFSNFVVGIVGQISPKTWAAIEVFLGSIAIEDYDSMAYSLIQMGATRNNVVADAFSRDLEKVFSSIKANVLYHT
ncbi:unnamed protein product [Vicia faba]|uniref:Uncharacterized protein n=1 Tax=Vicia faba TaxID=3906 RepID=A0AAV0YGW3_VICFA|nr:unnamed protein product [Vicia faba]